jgi:hypothetical protein
MSTISAISGSATVTPSSFSSLPSTLADILDGIDPTTATESDLEGIRNAIQEAGIRPGPALGKALSEAGFDPEAIRTAGSGELGAPPPPPPPPSAQMFDALKDILQDYEGQELTEEDIRSIQESLRESMSAGRLLNTYA